MKTHAHYFVDECWDAGLWLVWPVKKEGLDKFLRDEYALEGVTTNGDFRGYFVDIIDEDTGEELAGVIALKQWRGTPDDYSVLAHEALHATRWFLKNRGINFSGTTEEVYAYFLDSLVRRCAEQLNKRGRK